MPTELLEFFKRIAYNWNQKLLTWLIFFLILAYISIIIESYIGSQMNLIFTAKNTVISPNFLVWKFCGKAQFPNSFGKLCRNCAFPQNFHTRKLGEITVFSAVLVWAQTFEKTRRNINFDVFQRRIKNSVKHLRRCVSRQMFQSILNRPLNLFYERNFDNVEYTTVPRGVYTTAPRGENCPLIFFERHSHCIF